MARASITVRTFRLSCAAVKGWFASRAVQTRGKLPKFTNAPQAQGRKSADTAPMAFVNDEDEAAIR